MRLNLLLVALLAAFLVRPELAAGRDARPIAKRPVFLLGFQPSIQSNTIKYNQIQNIYNITYNIGVRLLVRPGFDPSAYHGRIVECSFNREVRSVVGCV